MSLIKILNSPPPPHQACIPSVVALPSVQETSKGHKFSSEATATVQAKPKQNEVKPKKHSKVLASLLYLFHHYPITHSRPNWIRCLDEHSQSMVCWSLSSMDDCGPISVDQLVCFLRVIDWLGIVRISTPFRICKRNLG